MSNVKLGNKTLKKNTGIGNNTGLGNESLVENKKGFQNTSIGAFSLNKNDEGYNNSAVGYKALENSKNNNNSAFGVKSGETLVNGKSNVLIGKEADVSKGDAKNQIVIGANAKGDDDNSVTLGNSEVTKVNMSESKNAEVNCGQVNVYNIKGKKSYSLPTSDGKKNQIIKTDGKGNLRWTNDSKGNGGGNLSISNNPPTVSDRSGNAGDLRYDDNFLYVCLGNNNWEKNALTTMIYDWVKLGDDIDGDEVNDRSGRSVSLSSDGSRVAIGAYLNDGTNEDVNDNRGHVKIYDWNGSAWVQVGSDIDGEAAGDFSGYSVSLSSDGTRVAIGAYLNDDNGTNSGHVRIYEYNSSTSAWVKLGNDIDGEAEYDYSGTSVSLSSDGSRVAIGANENDGNGSNSGHVRIYEYNSTTSAWDKLGDDIDGEAEWDLSGVSVSLSGDGSRVAIGAIYNDGNGNESGHVRIYEYNSTTSAWSKLGDDIDGEAAVDRSGDSVSLSSDGSRVAIGAIYNDGNGTSSGHVRIYEYNSSTSAWIILGNDIDGEAEYDNSGRSVSLSADGTRVAIGAHNNDGNGSSSGHVRIYDWNGSAWVKVGSDIDGETAGDKSGASVSLSSDGTRVAIGAYLNNGNGIKSGHTRIYELKFE